MKSEEEIEKLSQSMLKTIDSVVLLTTTKEEENIFHQGFYSGYRQGEKETFTREELIQCMSKATRWDTFNENEPEYKMDMDEFFDYIIKQVKK